MSFADGVLTLEMGAMLTGIRYGGELPFPRVGYELRLQARRRKGSDFFCGLTFPYRDGDATLILGGWGGALVGISCLDGEDAAENESASYQPFKTDQWYAIRLRVRDGFIDAWIDDQRVVAVRVRGRTVGVRDDVAASRPLGLTTFQTCGEIKQFAYRVLSPPTPSRGTDSDPPRTEPD